MDNMPKGINLSSLAQKRQTLKVFISMLQSRGLSKNLEKAMLYGSTARGDVQPDSDIDVLLFSRRPKQIATDVANASFETMLKTGDRVEAFVYPLESFTKPDSYFLVRALKEGKTIRL